MCSTIYHCTERHLVRHQEKDEEAGGEGLGDLQTRKKLWRDADGRIVTKRPTQSADQQQARKKQPDMSEESFPVQDNYFAQDGYQEFDPALLSPPGTLLGSDSMDQFSLMSPGNPLPEQHLVSQDDIFDFLANSTWGDLPSSAMDMQVDAPMDDMFRPDTGTKTRSILGKIMTNFSQPAHSTCLSQRYTITIGFLIPQLSST